MNISDELLNDFIDGILKTDEVKIVKEAIEKSPEVKSRYMALVSSDDMLRKLKSETVSQNFTQTVLQKIQRRKALAKQQKRFLFVVLSFMGVIVLGIVGLIFYQVISLSSPESNQVVTDYSKDVGNYFSNLFGKKNISVFGSVLSFIMLVSAYFFYEFQKKSKNNFTH